MKTVVVTGADQLLGYHLMRELSRDNYVVGISLKEPPDLPPGTFHQKCAITSYSKLESLLQEIKPSVVLNAADFDDTEKCEDQPGKAFDLNVKSVFYLARLSSLLRFKLVHFSTDLVFDGHSGPYEERDVTGPLNFYGDTKLQAEDIVQYLVQEYLLVRTSMVYGDGSTTHQDFIRRLLKKLESGVPTGEVVDQWSTPTFAGDVAEITTALLDQDLVGLYHVAGPDFVSRNYYAHAIADFFGYERHLIKLTTSHFVGKKATIPERGGLRSIKLKAVLGYAPNGISEGLQAYERR